MSSILDGVEAKPIGDAGALEAIADEVEAGRGPMALVRPGHRPVVLVSAEEWRRLEELDSEESTAWWRRDAAEREAAGEGAREGEDAPGIDEDEFRRRFAYLFRNTGAALQMLAGGGASGVRPRAQRQLSRLPEIVATAAPAVRDDRARSSSPAR